MRAVYIVSAVRTPVGRNNGYLRKWTAPELLGAALKEAARRIDLDPALVDDVITGTVYQVGEQGFTLARMAVLAAGFPVTVPGVSVNRQCGSSLTAIQMAHGMIASGTMDIVIAGGCELMSKYGMFSDLNGTLYNGNPMGNPFGPFYTDRFGNPDQIEAAQMIADQWGITKEECQDFAVASHRKAHEATTKGYFKNEILPMRGLDKEGREITRDTDETIRPETSRESLEALKVLPKTKWITAGLSSTITDGSSAVVLMGEDRMRELKVEPLARIVANAVAGSDPRLMLTGPIYATPKVLSRAGLKLADMDIYEINEAFAPIPLAWAKELQADLDRLNVNGGAMALGHPVGNSGCRLMVTAVHELRRRGGRYALVSLCTGGGMAPATVIERA
ncbi:MAG TPA: thiolase family protein [Syntrophales bacterium]|nr:thiolase family protein [Syntrophales bacterium]HOM06636.1 thiolase family protein [Syntrophales bacterium]HON99786.1 thiolase family protein [Syntrophales bacterium]HPC01140.1 thiolase family protein [Syntrophales bacterium]HPQ06297.1 thiolase family protein [Syntrophales bacterium]